MQACAEHNVEFACDVHHHGHAYFASPRVCSHGPQVHRKVLTSGLPARWLPAHMPTAPAPTLQQPTQCSPPLPCSLPTRPPELVQAARLPEQPTHPPNRLPKQQPLKFEREAQPFKVQAASCSLSNAWESTWRESASCPESK